MALTLAAVLAAGSVALAQRSAEAATIDGIMADFNAYRQSNQTVMEEAGQVIDFAVDSLQEATALLERNAPVEERRAWATRFNAEADRRISQVHASNAAVREPSGQVRQMLGPQRMRALAAVAQGRVQMVGAAEDLLREVRASIGRFINDDPDAAIALYAQLMNGMAANVEAENTLLEAQELFSGPEHPQGSLSRAQRELNSAVAQVFIYESARARGLRPSATDARRRMLEHIAQARTAARATPLHAQAQLNSLETRMGGTAALNRNPELRAFAVRIRTAFGTYAPSAEVELRLADVLEDLAQVFTDDDQRERVMARMEPLIDQRIALHERRVRAVVSGGA